ncbi:hypothetical protein LshimejAT787_0111300 [Lyophyllum shimeji]|uniref:Uncharacterized protein n=1 Tax=Lyophyllum shimeji TaxID=47721 RepID=A0A9P3PEZ2_LYOSH|nr:hypothetical protein LshimejAT787_0111300 [Lyophyllum shimeji]
MASESSFNYFVGGLALLSTVFSMLVYLNVYLPGPRMKAFDELLVEAREIYEKARGEDLLPPEMSRQAQAKLRKFEFQADDLRAAVYQNTSPVGILLSFFGGHSSKIAELARDVKGLRRDLLTTSQKERARRLEELLDLPQEGTGRTCTSEMPPPTGQHDHRDSRSPDSAEPRSSTIEHANTTPTSSISNSIPPSGHSVSYVCSVIEWFSGMFSWSKSYPQGDVEQPPSSPDIEARSRSSTLVEERMRKNSSYWKISTKKMFVVTNVATILIPLCGMIGIWTLKFGSHNV